jgi:hypothetical protein
VEIRVLLTATVPLIESRLFVLYLYFLSLESLMVFLAFTEHSNIDFFVECSL